MRFPFFVLKKRKTQLELERWSSRKVKVREGGINSYLGWNNDRWKKRRKRKFQKKKEDNDTQTFRSSLDGWETADSQHKDSLTGKWRWVRDRRREQLKDRLTGIWNGCTMGRKTSMNTDQGAVEQVLCKSEEIWQEFHDGRKGTDLLCFYES